MEKPLSAIGNIPENYLMFLLGGGIVFYFVTLFLIKIHIKQNIKISWELYLLPVLILLTLTIPYKEEFLLGKILHTMTGIIGAVLILFLMYKINKYYFPENPLIQKITKNIPPITIIGTLILFITMGMNVIMQLFYLTTTLIWINLTAFSKPKQKKTKKG